MSVDLSSFDIHLGASESSIQEVGSLLGFKLPECYARLVRLSDGVESETGLVIYGVSDVVERNATFEVAEYAPGYLAIGDDSGGRSVLVPLVGPCIVYIVDQGSLDPDDFEKVASDLLDWLSGGGEVPV